MVAPAHEGCEVSRAIEEVQRRPPLPPPLKEGLLLSPSSLALSRSRTCGRAVAFLSRASLPQRRDLHDSHRSVEGLRVAIGRLDSAEQPLAVVRMITEGLHEGNTPG